MPIRRSHFGEVISTQTIVQEDGTINEKITWGFVTKKDEAEQLRLQTVQEFRREQTNKGRVWETGQFPVHIEDVPTLAAAE